MSRFWSNIISNQGLELAAAGTLLVFGVLVLVSLCISLLPRLLSVLAPLLDRGLEPDVPEGETETEAVAAAAAMHAHLNQTKS